MPLPRRAQVEHEEGDGAVERLDELVAAQPGASVVVVVDVVVISQSRLALSLRCSV